MKTLLAPQVSRSGSLSRDAKSCFLNRFSLQKFCRGDAQCLDPYYICVHRGDTCRGGQKKRRRLNVRASPHEPRVLLVSGAFHRTPCLWKRGLSFCPLPGSPHRHWNLKQEQDWFSISAVLWHKLLSDLRVLSGRTNWSNMERKGSLLQLRNCACC